MIRHLVTAMALLATTPLPSYAGFFGTPTGGFGVTAPDGNVGGTAAGVGFGFAASAGSSPASSK